MKVYCGCELRKDSNGGIHLIKVCSHHKLSQNMEWLAVALSDKIEQDNEGNKRGY